MKRFNTQTRFVPLKIDGNFNVEHILSKDGKVKEDLKRTGDKEQFYNEIITNWC